ncbi:MaoC family dehydratase N-terminal domain-containing protein [Nocardioides sp. NPDC023903]|uniref:FAS1-like dehydratase domain-containing protein n=1 Tax=Nocardioides sp. NPDC023903 TaxID=3157195 RepID=UPI0033ECBFAE
MSEKPRDVHSVVDEAVHEKIMAAAEEIEARGEAAERDARDLVNQPTINNWLEAMGLESERFHQGEAPPSMAQVWTMYGQGGVSTSSTTEGYRDPLHAMMNVLTDAGFDGVLGTNSEQSYDRYLRVGEQVRITTALDSVVGPKSTGMGVGYFVTSRSTWYVGDERVATMLFRVLKFIPKVTA